MEQYVLHRIGDEGDELYHHGVKGMKWGVRRYQNTDGTLNSAGIKRRDKTIRKINTMYDHSNKWTDRKITKLDKKGKTAKADVMREMRNRNEIARQTQTSNIKKMNAEQYNKARRAALKDWAFGGQMWMKRNQTAMMTPLNRLSEYNSQRGMRWASNFTLNNTLKRMNPSEGYQYLDKKNIYSMGYSSGVNIR